MVLNFLCSYNRYSFKLYEKNHLLLWNLCKKIIYFSVVPSMIYEISKKCAVLLALSFKLSLNYSHQISAIGIMVDHLKQS